MSVFDSDVFDPDVFDVGPILHRARRHRDAPPRLPFDDETLEMIRDYLQVKLM